jgi:hypothetical protein
MFSMTTDFSFLASHSLFPFLFLLTEIIMLDNNDLNGTMYDVCLLDTLTLTGADCDEVDCGCCDFCCTDGSACHDLETIASVNPGWETGYERSFFQFSEADNADTFQIISKGGDTP